MFAIAVMEADKLEVVEVPKPEPGPYQALIRTEIAAICNMTDRKVVEAHFPGLDTYPLLLGHENAGVVEAVGEKVRNFKVGDRVLGALLIKTTDPDYGSGWGGFSEYILAGDHQAMMADGVADEEHDWFEVYEIMSVVTQNISLEDAVMLCMWRECYSGLVEDFRLGAGDDILIYGDGPVGLSFVKFARLLNFGDIYLVGKYPEKLQKAMEMGATATFHPDDEALKTLAEDRGKKLDGVIDAVGKEGIINDAMSLIKWGGTIGIYGVIDASSIHLEHGKGPFNFDLVFHQWPTREGELAAQTPLVEWIEAGKLSYKEFVSGEFPIKQISEAYEFSKVKQTIKTLLRY